MKLLITGSRDITSQVTVDSGIYFGISGMKYSIDEIDTLVSGGALGVDSCGELWAMEHSISVKRFRPDWNKFGRGAGMVRNKEMVHYLCLADEKDKNLVVGIWDGKSNGTRQCLTYAIECGLKTFVYIPDSPIFRDMDGWYFWDETWADKHGPFKTWNEVNTQLKNYCEHVLGG